MKTTYLQMCVDMDGEEFYSQFKEALEYLGLRWHEKNMMQVKAKKGKIIFEYDGRRVELNFKEEK